MSENNEIQVFQFENGEEKSPVRVVDHEGEPWFVATDVCEALGIHNVTSAVRALDEDERNTLDIMKGNRGYPVRNVVNESGLYHLIMVSRKPEAAKFRRWVTHEVLPSIRKRGLYATEKTMEELLSNPDHMIRIFTELRDERTRRRQMEERFEEQRPKMLFADAVAASDNSVLIGDFAKVLRQNGVDMGEVRLFDWLRENGYLMKSGSSRNLPTQRSMERGWFEIQQGVRYGKHGPHVTRTTKMTGKGQIYFSGVFLSRVLSLPLEEGA